MLTYLARPRGLYTEPENVEIQFPCLVEVIFAFDPEALFGGDGKTARTVQLGARARLIWNACRGETSVLTDRPLPLIQAEYKANDGSIRLNGASMKLSFEAESRAILQTVLETYYYCIPALLSMDLKDTPIIAEVRGTAGAVPFCWGFLESGAQGVDVVTEQIQEERILTAFKRLALLDEKHNWRNRRLLAATQYFYIACRLRRAENKIWEFLSEALLNHAKILEVLFPAPREKTIEFARAGLKALGFSELEIEALFIPTLALRNAIDVAHPTLATFSPNEAIVLHHYADIAEDAFRILLQRIFQQVEEGSFTLQPAEDIIPSPKAKNLIERIAHNLTRYDAWQKDEHNNMGIS